VAKKKVIEVAEEENAAQFELLVNTLVSAGYEHYEISNLSKPDLYSRHNSNYWKQEHYLGVGPSAHSYNTQSRQFNASNNIQYLKAIKSGNVPFTREILSRENKINEYVFTTLRTKWGCSLEKLKVDYAFDLVAIHADYISELVKRKLATFDNSVLRLTFEGKLLADKISLDLMV
jgi:oxygen-independent coproporphyrinogen-3 oxidase